MRKSLIKISDKFLNGFIAFSMIATFVFLSNYVRASEPQTSGGSSELNGTLGQIMGILSMLGFAIAILKILQIGMMFMIGAGKGKSDAKSAIIPWLVGAAVCVTFGTVGPYVIGLLMGGGSEGVFGI